MVILKGLNNSKCLSIVTHLGGLPSFLDELQSEECHWAGSDCVFEDLSMFHDASVPPNARKESPYLLSHILKSSSRTAWSDINIRHFSTFLSLPENYGGQGGHNSVSQAKLFIICRCTEVNRVHARMHLSMYLVFLQPFPKCVSPATV